MTTTSQLTSITAQHNEIVKRLAHGSLDPLVVKRALQDIIEGKVVDDATRSVSAPNESIVTLGCCGEMIIVSNRYLDSAWAAPRWYRGPKCQLARARQLWPNAVLPQGLLEVFTPRTKYEVLLLHVPDSFDSLWDKVGAPAGYDKYRWGYTKSDRAHLRLSPSKRPYTQPVWLGFNPERGKNERPDSFWVQGDCAASEVLSALIQFPDWCLAWSVDSSAPNLSGYQLKYYRRWLGVPCIDLWANSRQLALYGNWAGSSCKRWASPSVKEC